MEFSLITQIFSFAKSIISSIFGISMYLRKENVSLYKEEILPVFNDAKLVVSDILKIMIDYKNIVEPLQTKISPFGPLDHGITYADFSKTVEEFEEKRHLHLTKRIELINRCNYLSQRHNSDNEYDEAIRDMMYLISNIVLGKEFDESPHTSRPKSLLDSLNLIRECRDNDTIPKEVLLKAANPNCINNIELCERAWGAVCKLNTQLEDYLLRGKKPIAGFHRVKPNDVSYF